MPGTYLLPHDAPGTNFSSRPWLSLGDREIGGKQYVWWIPPFRTRLTPPSLGSQLICFISGPFLIPCSFLWVPVPFLLRT